MRPPLASVAPTALPPSFTATPGTGRLVARSRTETAMHGPLCLRVRLKRILGLALSQDNVPAGTLVTLSGTVDDTQYNNTNGTEPTQNIAAAEYYVDVPPWWFGDDRDPFVNRLFAAGGSLNADRLTRVVRV